MIRLETATEFWEASIEDTKLVRRYGKLGAKGRTTAKSLSTRIAARYALLDEIAEKTAEGYQGDLSGSELVEVLEPEPREPSFDELLTKNPGDGDAALVYADWLQTQQAPRGELMMIQHGLLTARGADAKKLRQELLRVMKKFGPHLLGPLNELENLLELKWRLGFIQEARVVADRSKRVKEVIARIWGKPNLSKLLLHLTGDLLGLRSAAFLEALTLESVGGRDYGAVLELVGASAPTTLRKLCIPMNDYLAASLGVLKTVDSERGAELGFSIGDYADAGLDIGLKPLVMPGLAELVIEPPIGSSGEVSGLELLSRSTLPNLEVLELNCAARRASAEHLRGFYDVEQHPRLRKLRFKGARFARDLVADLLAQPIALQLEVLDLSNGVLDDFTAGVLASAKSRLPRLRRAVVHRTGLSRAGLDKLKAAGFETDLPVPPPPTELSHDAIRGLCEDERVEVAARELAEIKHWRGLGRDKHRLWGTIYAGALYNVLLFPATMTTSCNCPSRKHPCKHGLALMFLSIEEEILEGKKPEWLY